MMFGQFARLRKRSRRTVSISPKSPGNRSHLIPGEALEHRIALSAVCIQATDQTGPHDSERYLESSSQLDNAIASDDSQPILPPLNSDPFPNVPWFGGARDWNLNLIDAPEVWEQGFTGEGVVVAVVDTGVDVDHLDLSSNIWRNLDEIAGNRRDDDGNGYVDDVFGWDFVFSDSVPNDANGHGTHVAGTIAAARNQFGTTGVAYDATIMPVRVLNSSGSGSSRGIAAGVRYAVDNGADIINLSLGSQYYSRTIHSALVYAARHDVLVVAAAGNEGSVGPGYPARIASVSPNVISVGAHDRFDQLAGFSNDVGTSNTVQVDAPGVSVLSTIPNNRYSWLNGTSMAAPHVAGLSALALSANPELSAEMLRTLIVEGADRMVLGSDSFEGINASLTVSRAATQRLTTSDLTQVRQAGDADTDLRFDQHDIILVLQARKYQTNAWASWNEGDWNGDGRFDQRDIIAALQTGNYLHGPYVESLPLNSSSVAAI